MPHKGTKLGDRPTQAEAFAVFISKRGGVGVRIGRKRAYSTASEVTITAGYVRVTASSDGLLLEGEGVVRQHKQHIAITA